MDTDDKMSKKKKLRRIYHVTSYSLDCNGFDRASGFADLRKALKAWREAMSRPGAQHERHALEVTFEP